MHLAATRGTVARMKDFTPTSLPPMPGREVPRLPPRDEAGEQAPSGPRYEPSEYRFRPELGDGLRQTLPAEFVEGRGLPLEDLAFEVRQHTIAETCRCFRLAYHAGRVNFAELENQLVRSAIRKIGTRTREELSDGDFDAWFADIGPQGFKYVDELVSRLNRPLGEASTLFQSSYRANRAQRRHKYELPALGLPMKRWSERTGIPAKWVVQVEQIDKKRTRDISHWEVDGKEPELEVRERLTRDLSFVLTEITVAQESSVADLAADPDDVYACRMLAVMLAIVEIGGRPLGDSDEDMDFKLTWLEDIGERHRTLVTGTYAKLNEVDRTALSRFCDAAVPLE